MQKYHIYSFLLSLTALIMGCEKAEIKTYSDVARLQLLDSTTQNYSFFYEPAPLLKDTFWVTINTIGGFTNADRPYKLIQLTEYRDSVVRDPITNLAIDTIKIALDNKAVPDQHFVNFEDPELKKLFVIKANQVSGKIPIVLLRDKSLKEQSFRLRIGIQANDVFELGEKQSLEKTIIFSERLERFESWKNDNSSSPAFFTFGRYSTAKHQFMYETLQEPIDEAWYKAVIVAQAATHYGNLFKEALLKFNTDPINLANGKAPLKENGPNSSNVIFP